MTSRRKYSAGLTWYIVGGVLLGHVAIVCFLVIPTQLRNVIPNRNIPYIPPPRPANFGSRTYIEVNPETGERYSVTEFVVSTEAFTTTSSTGIASDSEAVPTAASPPDKSPATPDSSPTHD